ncbi:hypothetical protein Vadar_013839 [Vaccinium darrowii]|uniref:Uncharacterized protein n=1 Tax=Vaccinium darrowii TaxID=229202 RepID=A0ACB7XQT9_9ERIC|nr:hypothetical protein Vadar_013839 [Vaccinium darrowii]
MALNFISVSLHPKPPGPSFLNPKHKNQFKLHRHHPLSSFRTATQTEGTQGGGVTEEEDPQTYPGSFPSARTQLDLLEQLTSTSSAVDAYDSDGSSQKLTIRDQLVRLVGDRDDDFSIPLGKDLKKFTPKFLTISQKRNIKRQAYLNEVSQRNDSVFFATIGAFVILPPLVILAIAILTGYVQLFP